MSVPAVRAVGPDAAPSPAPLRARPGLRRVMVSGLTAAGASEGRRLRLSADLLVREASHACGDDLGEVLNYEIVVHTLRRASRLELPLSDIAERACMDCFGSRDVVEVRVEAVWDEPHPEAMAGGGAVAVAHRIRLA